VPKRLAGLSSTASASLTPTGGEGEMASFETIFGIPPAHVLRTKYHSSGGGRPDSWVLEEYNDEGEFVARYECRTYTDDGIRISGGLKKFDVDGVLVASEDGLPI
jgi:hypothetical protein